MKQIRNNIMAAMSALIQNRLRTLLTVGGVMIGVISIVTLIAILRGVKNEITRRLEGLGANLVMIVPGKLADDGQPNPGAMFGISSLNMEDADALRRVPGVARVSPVSILAGTVRRGSLEDTNSFVVATNSQGARMNPTPLVAGNYFTDLQPRTCILAYKPCVRLFGTPAAALGQRVKISDKDWTVVGVLSRPAASGGFGGMSGGFAGFTYLQISTVQAEIPDAQVNRIVLQTDYKHPADRMIGAMRDALFASHNKRDDFGIITQQKGLELVIHIVNLTQTLLVLIASISLVVGGVGVMNIMLITVTERTREIGIRKTVGARRADVFAQFLVEAVLVSLAGGAAGIAVSEVLCRLIAWLSPLTPEITLFTVFLALTVCGAVGVLFGVGPAIRASRLQPVDALRYE